MSARRRQHGLTAAGRYPRFTVRCVDRPGQRALLLNLIAEQKANVIDVLHQRHNLRLRLGEVEIELSVETRAGRSTRTGSSVRCAPAATRSPSPVRRQCPDRIAGRGGRNH
jgi:threonine dehydratase